MATRLVLSILFALTCDLLQAHASSVLTVCSHCALTSIQQAIDQAAPGTVIKVEPGTYREHGITVKTSLTLEGDPANPSAVIVDGEGVGSVFFIKAPSVKIAGFTVRHSGIDYTEDLAGIKVMDSQGCVIENNKLQDNAYGIYVGSSRACRIAHNSIIGIKQSETSSGDGIHIWHGTDITIEENTMTGNRDGIYLEFANESHIKSNQILHNTRYGLHFMFSNHNEFVGNTFSHNLSGVAVMYSHHIQIHHNVFEYSLGPAAYGILLKDIFDSQLTENKFYHNTFGAYLEGVTRAQFSRNVFRKNGWALRVLGAADSNVFTHNDFLSNTFDVSTNASKNMNVFTQNHWSQYRGLDLNHDGIGDDPYRVVQLSSLLMEQYGASVLLFRSFFFSLLDQIESALPAFIPATYEDLQPMMGRVAHD